MENVFWGTSQNTRLASLPCAWVSREQAGTGHSSGADQLRGSQGHCSPLCASVSPQVKAVGHQDENAT